MMNTFEDIILNPDMDLFKKLIEIYPLFTTIISGEELLNHEIHVFDDVYGGGGGGFAEKIDDSFIHHAILYSKDVLQADDFDINLIENPEFIQYVIDKGFIVATHTIQCSCCKYPVFVKSKVDFVNFIITVEYDKDTTNKYSSRFKDMYNYGNESNRCVDSHNKNKLTFNFKCRSGKIAIANILKDLPLYIDNKPTEYISINEKFGMMQMMRHWEKHNFLYMQCGNSCPSVLQNSNGDVLIGSQYEDCECDCEECTNPFPEYENKGYVCTDLWAVHIVDYEDFKGFEDEIDHIVLDVSNLGEDIVVEYNYDYMDWDSQESVLLTMKRKKV